MGRKLQRGLTLIELMTVLLVAAILIAIAVPGFDAMARRTQQANAISDLATMLARARSEAVTRSRPITVCVSTDQEQCDDDNSAWEEGWILFVDGDSGVAPNRTVDGDDEILQVGTPLKVGTLRASGFSTGDSAITILADGTATSTGTFRYCGPSGLDSMRALVLNLAGQVRIATDANNDGTPEDESGKELTSCT